MSKYEDPTQLDYRYGGDTVDDFAQKYMKTIAYIFSALNELRSPTGGTLTQNPEAYQLKVDDNKLYIRNQANTDWILLGDIKENFGFRTSASDAFMHESDVADSGTAGKLIRADASGKLNADILGNAAKIADKAIQMGLDLADEDRLVYDKDTDTITNRPLQFKVDGDKIYARKDATTSWILLGDVKENFGFRSSTDDAFLTESDVTDKGAAGKLIRADVNGKLNADILGNARKMAGKTFAPEDLQDGQIPVYRASDGTWHAEDKGTVGTGKNLMIMDGDKMLGEYNGDEMKAIDIQKSSLTKALAESTGYGIVSGCEPSINGLTVTVSAGVIHTADGRRIEVPEQSITLDAADASNPRIDIVEVDKDGALCKVNGTPAATPDAPQSASNCIMLAKITIATAGKTMSLIDMRQWKNRYHNLNLINVKDYGAKGDGVTDDTAAIQKAIDNNLGKTIFFPHGTYIVSDTIYTYRGDSKRSLLHLIDAHIKASNSFPLDEGKFIISIGDASTGDVNNYWDSHSWCGLIGGIIDGSSRAYGGVKYSESSIGKLMDFTVINACKVGMQIGESSDSVKSTDVYVSRVKLDGINKEESIGLLVYSYDNNIEYLRTSGFPIGIKIIGGGNYFRECHPLYDRNQYDKEIGFEVAGNDTFINNCYADMFATAIQIETYSTTKIDGFFYTRASSRKKNAVFLKNTVGAVTFYVKNFTIGFVSSDISSKIYDGVRYCQESFTPTSAYGFYDGKIYGKSITPDDLGAYSELAHQIVYQVTDDIDLNNLLATGTYWIENIKTSNNTKNHRPADLTPYGIIKVNSLPALKGARFLFAEQEVFNQADLTPTTKYYRSYFGELSTDGKTLAGTWGAWRKISLA